MLRAIVGVVAVLVIPGAVIACAMRASFRSLATWAVVPALSLAAVFVVGEISDLAPWPFNAWTVTAFVVLGIGLLAGLRPRIRNRESPVAPVTESSPSAREDKSVVIARVLLLLAMATSLGILIHGIGSHDLVPPEIDASNHGFFVARVIETGSVNLRQVVVSDVDAKHRIAAFYPLGMHASAAIASETTGADVGQVLLALDVIFAALVFPLGMFVLAQMLVPNRPLVAGFSAFVAVVLNLFPYGAIPYGDVPLVMGMALVPITVVVIVQALTLPSDVSFRRLWPPIAAGALVAFTAVSVHSSQVPLIAALVTLLVLEIAWRKRSSRILTAALARAIVGAVLALLLFAPNLSHLVSGISERSDVTLTFPVSAGRAVRRLLLPQSPANGYRQLLLALIIAVGAVVLLLRRRFAWLVGYLLVLGVTFLVLVSNRGLSKVLGNPWYHSAVRLNFNQVFFVALFAGLTLAYAAYGLDRLRGVSLPLASFVVVALFVGTIGWSEYRNSSTSLKRTFAVDARVTDASLAAFDWLHANASQSDVVVNDQNADGSIWMYAFRRLHPLVAIKPVFSNPAAEADWNDRMYLIDHIGELGADSRADALVRQFGARWVYFDEQVFDLFSHKMNLDALRHDKDLQLVFQKGTVYVFKIRIPA